MSTAKMIRPHGAGLRAQALAESETVVRPRTGGERIQIAPDRPRRALSAWLSETGVASWDRAALPLVDLVGLSGEPRHQLRHARRLERGH